jgi:hypothetical protein
MNGHKQSIRSQNMFVPIGEHFNNPGHSIDNMRITVLQGHLRDLNKDVYQNKNSLQNSNAYKVVLTMTIDSCLCSYSFNLSGF